MSNSEINTNRQVSSLLPDTLIELFEIDLNRMQFSLGYLKDIYDLDLGKDLIYRFCSSSNSSEPVVWQQKAYQPLPIKCEGFEGKNDGRLPRPRLIISNPEGLFSRIIYSNNDFVGCKITRKRTYIRFLDAINFKNKNLNSEGVNPFGVSDRDSYLPEDIYYINRKLSEDKNAIQFELSSSLELDNAVLPARFISSNLCSWQYRCEVGCQYKGLPIESLDGENLRFGYAYNSSEKTDSFVNPDDYKNGIDSIPFWSKDVQGYKLNDLVKIVSSNSSNPYYSAPQVFVCIQSHQDASKHHPFIDKEYWIKDECQKSVTDCNKRFDYKSKDINGIDLGGYNMAKENQKINFGGFPGVKGYEHSS